MEDDYEYLKLNKKAKDRHDIFYKKAKENGWRARSAFKLMQIDDRYKILNGVTRAVDLCAAPGSWSQVLSRKLYLGEDLNRDKPLGLSWCSGEVQGEAAQPTQQKTNDVKLVAVDLQLMAPLPGVLQMVGDITLYSTAMDIINLFEGDKADLVLCDGAPDVTGLHDMDIYIQSQLLLAALHIACNVLKVAGNFVAKIFRGRHNNLLIDQYKTIFKEVYIYKPSSSRNSSTEAFIIALNYSPPEGFDPTLLTQYLQVKRHNFESLTGVNRMIIPYIVSGDISGYDIGVTYPSQPDHDGEAIAYKLPPESPISEIKPTFNAEEALKFIGLEKLTLSETTNSVFSTDSGYFIYQDDEEESQEYFHERCINSLQRKWPASLLLDSFGEVKDRGEDIAEACREQEGLEPIPQSELGDRIYAHKMKLQEQKAEGEKKVKVQFNFDDHVFQGEGVLIPEETPLFTETMSTKPQVLSVIDFINFDRDNGEADTFFKDLKETYEQSKKYKGRHITDDECTESYKHEINRYMLACNCGHCGK